MKGAVVWQAVPPTASALPWSPVVAVAATLASLDFLTKLDDRPSIVPVIAGGMLASAAIAALHDPADTMLSAVPTSRMSRRLLRLALVAIVIAPTVVLIAELDPATPNLAATTIALALAGLAAATWLPAPHGVLVAAVLPTGWMLIGLWLDHPAPVHGAATWWSAHPSQVALIAAATVFAGRHR